MPPEVGWRNGFLFLPGEFVTRIDFGPDGD